MKAPQASPDLQASLHRAWEDARRRRHEYLMLEHVLRALLEAPDVVRMLHDLGADIDRMRVRLEHFLDEACESLPPTAAAQLEETPGVQRVLQRAAVHALSAERESIDGPALVAALFREPSCHALWVLQQEGVTRLSVLRWISHVQNPGGVGGAASGNGLDHDDESGEGAMSGSEEEGSSGADPLESWTSDLRALARAGGIDPLVGREAELSRDIASTQPWPTPYFSGYIKRNPSTSGQPAYGNSG